MGRLIFGVLLFSIFTGNPRTASMQDSGENGSTTFDEVNIPRGARREYEDGVRLRQRGNCTEALAHFRKAIATYPKYGEAFTEMGNCLKQAGNLTEAENAFKSAIEYSRTVYASINLADMYVSQHRFAEAQQVIRTATKLDPLDGDLFFALARTYFDQNQMKEAEASALEAHSRVHRFPEVHLLLSKIYLANGNQHALLTQLETYLEESPKGPAADQVRQDISRIKAGR